MADEILPPCTECGKPSVTRDGRHLCKKCLRKVIQAETPIHGGYWGGFRTRDMREAPGHDSSPGGENAIRAWEDYSE